MSKANARVERAEQAARSWERTATGWRGEAKALRGEAHQLRAENQRLLDALLRAETFARSLHASIQRGAGCCGEAIGRGGRVLQVAEKIEELRRGKP